MAQEISQPMVFLEHGAKIDGHADIKTTAIYTNAVGLEERELAKRMLL